MNLTALSSYFVNIKMPLKNGHTCRTGLIVAYNRQKNRQLRTEDLLVLAYITDKEKKHWENDKDNSPWEVKFLFEDAEEVSACEVRSWEKSDGEGWIALLAKYNTSDENRNYESFEHFKTKEKMRLRDRGVVLWLEPDNPVIRTNLDKQIDDKPLSYYLEEMEKDNDVDSLLGSAGEKPGQYRQEIDDLCKLLVGAPVFREDGTLTGYCCSAIPDAKSISMDYTNIGFDIEQVLKKCGASRMHKAIKDGVIKSNDLAKTCAEIKEYFSGIAGAKGLSDIKSDFGKYLDKTVFPYFNTVTLERFLFHTRSGLKHLLESSNLLCQWKKMLSSLNKIGKTSVAGLALLGLLSGVSDKSHAIKLANLYGPPSDISLVQYPLYLDSLGIEDEDVIDLAAFIRSIQKEELHIEKSWYKTFDNIKQNGEEELRYKFALELRDYLRAKDKRAICELVERHYPDEEDEYRRQHIELAVAFQHLTMPKVARSNLSPDWQTLLEKIEEDIFCLS